MVVLKFTEEVMPNNSIKYKVVEPMQMSWRQVVIEVFDLLASKNITDTDLVAFNLAEGSSTLSNNDICTLLSVTHTKHDVVLV